MKPSILAVVYVLSLVISLVAGVQLVAASSETEYPFASGIYIRSPSNGTYSSSSLILNVSFTAFVASNIKHSMVYSLDGTSNNTIPTVIHSREHSVVALITGEVNLPTLSYGSHNVTVYAQHEIYNAYMKGVYYPKYVRFDNSTVYFTISASSEIDLPEFPSWILLPLFIVATLVVTFFTKRMSLSSKEGEND